MKKRILGMALALAALMALAVSARAEQAADITAQCKMKPSSVNFKLSRLSDRDYTTAFKTQKSRKPTLIIESGNEKIYGLYISWYDLPGAYAIERDENGTWTEIARGGTEGYAHDYIALAGETRVRIRPDSTKNMVLSINELFVLGAGDLPDYVQVWQPTYSECDILVLSAHPDDEILYMGGTIPYYAGGQNRRVAVAYMTYANNTRRSELLNGLWTCGVRHYPILGDFYDKYTKNMKTMYSTWGTKKVYTFLVSTIRATKPSVIVTHDVNGEYGHGAHKVCANAIVKCAQAAADALQYTDSAAEHGMWQAQKVYLHLQVENAIHMPWDEPLSCFGGKTAFEMAEAAYDCHQTQHRYSFFVEPADSAYSCYDFGLAYTLVGADEAGGDFLENIAERAFNDGIKDE